MGINSYSSNHTQLLQIIFNRLQKTILRTTGSGLIIVIHSPHHYTTQVVSLGVQNLENTSSISLLYIINTPHLLFYGFRIIEPNPLIALVFIRHFLLIVPNFGPSIHVMTELKFLKQVILLLITSLEV